VLLAKVQRATTNPSSGMEQAAEPRFSCSCSKLLLPSIATAPDDDENSWDTPVQAGGGVQKGNQE
jgi:hypothetical protein